MFTQAHIHLSVWSIILSCKSQVLCNKRNWIYWNSLITSDVLLFIESKSFSFQRITLHCWFTFFIVSTNAYFLLFNDIASAESCEFFSLWMPGWHYCNSNSLSTWSEIHPVVWLSVFEMQQYADICLVLVMTLCGFCGALSWEAASCMSNEHWWTNKHMEWIMRTSVFITPSSPISHFLTVGTLHMYNMNCTVYCVVWVILWTLLISFSMLRMKVLLRIFIRVWFSVSAESAHYFAPLGMQRAIVVSRTREVLLCTCPTLNTKSLSSSHDMICDLLWMERH